MVKILFVSTFAVLACGGEAAMDLGPDASVEPDLDASLEPQVDAASAFPLPGFGNISGDCNILDDELLSPSPSLVRSAFEFDRMYEDSDLSMLTMGGQQIIADGNAGGSSVLSEVFAFELLRRCEAAELLKTETNIGYDMTGKLTDFLTEIDSEKIGVSVTRAVAFPFDEPYQVAQATELLVDKLEDVLESSANVGAEDRWRKQILAILAYAPGHADAIAAAWGALDAETRADTVVHVIVTNGQDDFIYCDGVCPAVR